MRASSKILAGKNIMSLIKIKKNLYIIKILILIMEPKFIGKAKLTKQGQLTMPIEARNDLEIRADSDVYWYELDGVLVLTKSLLNTKEVAEQLFKMAKKG